MKMIHINGVSNGLSTETKEKKEKADIMSINGQRLVLQGDAYIALNAKFADKLDTLKAKLLEKQQLTAAAKAELKQILKPILNQDKAVLLQLSHTVFDEIQQKLMSFEEKFPVTDLAFYKESLKKIKHQLSPFFKQILNSQQKVTVDWLSAVHKFIEFITLQATPIKIRKDRDYKFFSPTLDRSLTIKQPIVRAKPIPARLNFDEDNNKSTEENKLSRSNNLMQKLKPSPSKYAKKRTISAPLPPSIVHNLNSVPKHTPAIPSPSAASVYNTNSIHNADNTDTAKNAQSTHSTKNAHSPPSAKTPHSLHNAKNVHSPHSAKNAHSTQSAKNLHSAKNPRRTLSFNASSAPSAPSTLPHTHSTQAITASPLKIAHNEENQKLQPSPFATPNTKANKEEYEQNDLIAAKKTIKELHQRIEDLAQQVIDLQAAREQEQLEYATTRGQEQLENANYVEREATATLENFELQMKNQEFLRTIQKLESDIQSLEKKLQTANESLKQRGFMMSPLHQYQRQCVQNSSTNKPILTQPTQPIDSISVLVNKVNSNAASPTATALDTPLDSQSNISNVDFKL